MWWLKMSLYKESLRASDEVKAYQKSILRNWLLSEESIQNEGISVRANVLQFKPTYRQCKGMQPEVDPLTLSNRM